MRKISTSTRAAIIADPFYQKCCLCGIFNVKIDFHHNLIYGGSQADASWTILPLCVPCHRLADRKDIKDKLNWIMINRATDKDFLSYPRKDWKQMKKYLTALHEKKII